MSRFVRRQSRPVRVSDVAIVFVGPVLANVLRRPGQPLFVLPQLGQLHGGKIFVAVRFWPAQRFEQTRLDQQRDVVGFKTKIIGGLCPVQSRWQCRQAQQTFAFTIHWTILANPGAIEPHADGGLSWI